MKHNRLASRAAVVLICFAASLGAACDDDAGIVAPGGTDAGSGEGGATSDGAVVSPGTKQLGSLTEACDGDASVTGQALALAVFARYDVSLMWRGDAGGDAGTDALTLAFSYVAGRILCHPAQHPVNGGDGPSIPAYVEVDFDFGAKTAAGSLDEQLVATVSGQSFGGGTGSLSFTGSQPVTAIRGTYVAPPEFQTLTIYGTLTGATAQGGATLGGGGKSEPVAAFR